MSSGTEIISAADYRAGLTGKSPRQAKVKPYPVAEPAVPGACYTFTYSGPGLSSNKWYAGVTWARRVALKKTWVAILRPLIAASGIQPMQQFRVTLRYCSRLDADNTTAMLKLFLDQIKGEYVPEDSPKYFKGFSVEYDQCLPHNTYIFSIIELI